METKTTNGLTQRDSNQAIPSPEDRVRAMKAEELLQKIEAAAWVAGGHDEFDYDATDLRAELLSRLSLVEELKGQVAAKEPTPEQIKAIKVGIIKKWQSWIGPLGNPDHYKIQAKMLELEVARETAETELALLRKRKDYHAEYVEAVEAAEKAERALRQLVTDKEPNRYPLWFNRAVYQCRDCDSEDLCVKHLEMAERDFKGCEQEIELFLAALTPEPASQAAKEKP